MRVITTESTDSLFGFVGSKGRVFDESLDDLSLRTVVEWVVE